MTFRCSGHTDLNMVCTVARWVLSSGRGEPAGVAWRSEEEAGASGFASAAGGTQVRGVADGPGAAQEAEGTRPRAFWERSRRRWRSNDVDCVRLRTKWSILTAIKGHCAAKLPVTSGTGGHVRLLVAQRCFVLEVDDELAERSRCGQWWPVGNG